MSNSTLITIYAALAAGTLALFILSWRKPTQDTLDTSFRFILGSSFGWQLVMLLFFCFQNQAVCRFLYSMNLPFVAFTSLAWFLYIIRFYGLDHYFPRVARLSLFIIPVFTSLLALTTTRHPYLRASFQMVSAGPVRQVVSTRGPWFWYHAAYCYALVVLAMVVALVQHRKTTRVYRHSSLLLLVGLGLTVVGNLLVLGVGLELDLSLLSASAASLLLFIINRNTHGLEYIHRARREVFQRIGHGVFILDDTGGIVSTNHAALTLMEQLELPGNTRSFAGVMEAVDGRATQKRKLDGQDDSVDYYLASEEIINIRQKPILDNRSKPIGQMVITTQVKDNRQIIDYLDRAAGIDALTGLVNRRRFEELLCEYEQERDLPLALMVGDLNNLKITNDRFGHPQGDIYIRLAAEYLTNACPPSAQVARMGGDEFTILIPGYSEQQCRRLAQEIQSAFASPKDYPFEASISLGWAVKTRPEESIQACLKQADEMMFENKRQYKAAERALA